MRTLLGLILGVLLPSAAMAEQFMLVCHLVPTPDLVGPSIDANFLVDTDKNTVNNRTATINDNMISWEDIGAHGVSTTYINRLTGKVVVSTNLGPVITGTCEKATQRKF